MGSFKEVSALTVSPVRMEISGNPGETIIKEITLLNDSTTKEETFYVSYSNFEAQGETGSPAFVEPQYGLGTWMSTVSSVTLAPNSSKNIPITITIPKEADPGGHFAVVFFGTNPNNSDGGQVSVGAKMGTLILLSVNGDVLESGGLITFRVKDKKFFHNSLPVLFQYRWKNDGNDRIKPEGKITIRNMFYIPVDRLNANAVSGNVLPHSIRLFETEWLKDKMENGKTAPDSFITSFFDRVSYQWKNFALGPYVANLNLVYGSENYQSSKNTYFFVFPWQLFICLVLALIFIFWVGKKIIKRYNKHIIEKARASMVNNTNDADNI